MMPNLEVLILQLLVTVGTARALGWCFGKLQQPAARRISWTIKFNWGSRGEQREGEINSE
jgi:hypothetical protein